MKKSFLSVLIILLLCLSLSASADSLLHRTQTVTISADEYARLSQYAKLDEVLQYIEAYYYIGPDDTPDVDKMLETAIDGLLAGIGDPYTFYYNEEEWAELWEDEEGEYTGVGLLLLGDYTDYSVTVTRVFRDTPAEKVGIRKGDLLINVGDITVTTDTMQEAVDVMRGEVGGSVTVTVYRDGEYLTFDIVRSEIHVNYVDYTMLDNNVGYVAVYTFSTENLMEDFNNAMDTLEAQGAKSIIIDLRDNPGGWVNDAVSLADRFLENKLVVYSQTQTSDFYDPRYTGDGADEIPLVLLVNENSASASEIVTGCMKHYGRATVVGTQTFGKGIMQSVVQLSDGKSGIQFTSSRYFTPDDVCIHGVGITPDIIVEMPENTEYSQFDLGDLSDVQLKTAWDEAIRLQTAAQ